MRDGGTDEYTLTTDGGETLQFCSEGCMETYLQTTSSRGGWREELLSWGGWYKIGNQYRKEWSMIWKDVIAGFLVSGFVIVFVPQWVWNTLFIQGDGLLVTAENAIMGVAIAVVSFVGSMGNVPFAVALWGGGISFAGVIAFVYADLITIPVLNVYRKYYGWKVMLYILGVFFVTMAFTGFLMELLFDASASSRIWPAGRRRPSRRTSSSTTRSTLTSSPSRSLGFSCTCTAAASVRPGSTATRCVGCGPTRRDRARPTRG